MLIVRKFELSARIEHGEEVEKILNDLGAVWSHVSPSECTRGGKTHIKAYWHDCSIPANRFEALIERLNEIPKLAFVTLTY